MNTLIKAKMTETARLVKRREEVAKIEEEIERLRIERLERLELEETEDIRLQVLDDLRNQETEIKEINNGNLVNLFSSALGSSTNNIITAPTQVGKTDAILQICATSIGKGIPVIITTDNSIGQREQVYDRLMAKRDSLFSEGMPKIVIIGQISITTLIKRLMKKKMFIFIALNNFTQIEKLEQFRNELTQKHLTLIHDEADLVTKDSNVNRYMNNQPKVHQQWIKFKDGCKDLNLHRYFVTATPENCLMKYPIKCDRVIPLLIPDSYQGWEKIVYRRAESPLARTVFIRKEITRITKECGSGIILVIGERKMQSHNEVVDDYITRFNVPVHSYNSEGIRVRFPGGSEKLWENLRETLQDKCKSNRMLLSVTIDKSVSLADFYTVMENIGTKCLITVGRDMLTRGLSCASKNSGDCLAAVSMVYIPGGEASMYGVGITQVIGRVCGSVRPDLERRVCTTEKVWNIYTGYCKSQEKYMEELVKASNNSKFTSGVIDTVPVINFGRLERKVLKCEYKNFEKTEPPKYSDVEGDTDRMKTLVNNWWKKDTIISKIFHFVLDNEVGVSETELKEFIKEIRGNETWYSDIHQHIKGGYSIVFERTSNRITKLRKEAIKYAKTK
jgi:hypothetical protein